MKLSVEEKGILGGAEGEAREFIMRIMSKLAEACDVDRFVPASSAHIAAVFQLMKKHN